ncbi:TetR/AcrR family transcriptional regulator [Bizionia gelidisalsuginis]|uniref:TetR/AcrR family transcriptional regulator n=2 Tax=Bizionia TaxID=283785 RepID=A0A8H2LL26_9FLAO|nr:MULTISPECIES: TetR family transcriptional regulator C-terminal domain-containing protein [Bizionia]TYB72625.1 TetR/AcrR family transcriptional regulator [Bizionia saleffrena]TYC18133.1 TetR/AcrR family transcriptional regulator [Bizionia gelidisalsuginis]
MAKKKNTTEQDLIAFYMDYVLEHSEQPKSVYAFSKMNNFEESKFYEHFSTFETLEKGVFKAFLTNTLLVLEANEDYQKFDPRDKLLSFYFTFFENLTANRSYVVYALKQHKGSLKSLTVLTDLKAGFCNYIEHLDIETLDIKEDRLEKLQQRSLRETAWLQLLLTMKFWLDDTSASFMKTDIFIEKAVNTSFDLLDIKPLKSLIDFGKFIYKEKFSSH